MEAEGEPVRAAEGGIGMIRNYHVVSTYRDFKCTALLREFTYRCDTQQEAEERMKWCRRTAATGPNVANYVGARMYDRKGVLT